MCLIYPITVSCKCETSQEVRGHLEGTDVPERDYQNSQGRIQRGVLKHKPQEMNRLPFDSVPSSFPSIPSSFPLVPLLSVFFFKSPPSLSLIILLSAFCPFHS